MHCAVAIDLARHLADLDRREAHGNAIEALTQERYQALTTNAEGMREMTEALYQDEPGFPLDEALFALFSAWRQGKKTRRTLNRLMGLLEEQASRMAQRWAQKQVKAGPS